MPPQNFRITRRVGSDSLLVAWIPPNDTEVSGYFVRISSSSKSDLLLTIYYFVPDLRQRTVTSKSPQCGSNQGPFTWIEPQSEF